MIEQGGSSQGEYPFPTSIIKGKIILDKDSHTASMEFVWKGHSLIVKAAYETNNFDEKQASADLEKTIQKIVANGDLEKAMHPKEKAQGLSINDKFVISDITSTTPKDIRIEFLKSPSPFSVSKPEKALDMIDHGQIPYDGVISKLANMPPGSYMMRDHPENPAAKIISYVNEKKGIDHLYIVPAKGQYLIKSPGKPAKQVGSFTGIVEIEEYKNLLRSPISANTPVLPLSVNDKINLPTSDNVMDLIKQPPGAYVIIQEDENIRIHYTTDEITDEGFPKIEHIHLTSAGEEGKYDTLIGKMLMDSITLKEVFETKTGQSLFKFPLIKNSGDDPVSIEKIQHAIKHQEVVKIFEEKEIDARYLKLNRPQALKLLKTERPGTFAIYDAPKHTQNKIVAYIDNNGKLKELECIHKKDARTDRSLYEVNGKIYRSLAEVMADPSYKDNFQQVVKSPFLLTYKSIVFNESPIHMPDEEIAKLAPEKLLGFCGKGGVVSPAQLIAAAEKLSQTLPQRMIDDPSAATTLHKLYDKAAELLLSEGRVTEAFQARSLAASKVAFNTSHPLYKMEEAIAAGVKKQSSPHLEAHFSEMGSGVLKGGNIRACTRPVNGKATNCFEFKISRYARNDIQDIIEAIRANPEAFKASLPDMLKGKSVKIEEVPHGYVGKALDGVDTSFYPTNAKALQIEFEGLGRFIIGNSPEIGCLITNVRVEMVAGLKEGEGLNALHQMLAVLGCGPVMGAQHKEDEERMKVAQIFRAFFPSQAITMEQAKEFYEIPIEDLKEKIIEQVPEMKPLLEKYLIKSPQLLYKEEIYPGRTVWCVADLADQIKAQNVCGLVTGISSIDRAARVLIQGYLSTQDRFMVGEIAMGTSPMEDFSSGGADQVFTRMVTPAMSANEIETYPSHGIIQVLWDLSVVNRVSYGFDYDHFGNRNPQDKHNFGAFENRTTLKDLASQLNQDSINNEVMVKNRIAPDYVRGFVVQTDADKALLIGKLRADGLIYQENGVDMIRGYPLDKFVYLSSNFKPEMWNKA